MKRAIDIILEKDRPMVSVTPQTTIWEALQMMVADKIGAIVVKEDENVVGIWTERDLMNNIVQPDFDSKTAKIQDYMSRDLKTVNFDEPIYKLPDLMLGLFIRHLFVVQESMIIGLLSIGDVFRACLIERTRELESVSWEYYENWRWGRKR
ncbi:MAG: CBS domain-containing protein [Candidatus Neomarinimicrobiota bacterium]